MGSWDAPRGAAERPPKSTPRAHGGRPREVTGGHGRLRDATGGHGRPRDATGCLQPTGSHERPLDHMRAREARNVTGSNGRYKMMPREATGCHRGIHGEQLEFAGSCWKPRVRFQTSQCGSPLGGPSLVGCCFLHCIWLYLFQLLFLLSSDLSSLLNAIVSLLSAYSFSCTFLASRSMIAQVFGTF